MGNSFPQQGEYCPICKDRAERFHKHQQRWLDEGDTLLQAAIRNKAKIKIRSHTHIRSTERCFNRAVLIPAIESGYVIERQVHEGNRIVWIVSSSIKIGACKYRPIHFAISFEDNVMYVITIYDPRSHAWKWDKTFSKRLCWCQNEIKEV